MTFLHSAFLFGLAALAIPPVVHLLNRRRYEVVEWAAVMFLPDSPNTRARLNFQHLPLMLLRMLLIALLVGAFAAPQFSGCHTGPSARGTPHDIVILIDGSASMARSTGGSTPADRAREYARNLLDTLDPRQRVAIYCVKQRLVPLLEPFSVDREQAKNSLELMPQPSGTADWPAAISQAGTILESSANADIVVLSDDQRFGWADPETMTKWSLLSQGQAARPNVQVVSVGVTASTEASNAGLEPIRCDRAIAVAGREIAFRSGVRFTGAKLATTVRVMIDGQPTNTLSITPAEVGSATPFSFVHHFSAGSHLVTFELLPDSYGEDNRQDFALEVLPAIPVLIVDGGRGGEFLRHALAPHNDATPAFVVRNVPAGDWQSGLLNLNVAGPNTSPRTVAVMDVERLTVEQARQIERYLRDGGSVFVALGERCDAAAWNRVAFRGGEGFLPARVLETVGGLAADPMAKAPRPQTASFTHRSLEIFIDALPGGLATAIFPKYWKLDPAAGAKGNTGTAIASLSNRDPWLVERSFGSGRVVLSAHPFDNSWKTNLHRLPDFVRLSHEIFYFLSGTHAAQRNLQPGQPLIFSPIGDEPPGETRIRMPDGRVRNIAATSWPVVVEGTGEPGAYQLSTQSGRQYWYAVAFDPREADFVPNSQADRNRVAELAGRLEYRAATDRLRFEGTQHNEPRELWWLPLALVFVLLLAEISMTRRLVRSGEHLIPDRSVP